MVHQKNPQVDVYGYGLACGLLFAGNLLKYDIFMAPTVCQVLTWLANKCQDGCIIYACMHYNITMTLLADCMHVVLYNACV